MKSIYNAMLERTGGFVPMSEEEFDVHRRPAPPAGAGPARALPHRGGERRAGGVLPHPPRLERRHQGGRRAAHPFGLPVGLAKMAWAARRIDRLRVLLLRHQAGLPAPRHRRAPRTWRRCARRGGSATTGGELGWTTEDNDLMNRAIESMGARRYKTYRIYDKTL